jgi:hypothetical protein
VAFFLYKVPFVLKSVEAILGLPDVSAADTHIRR